MTLLPPDPDLAVLSPCRTYRYRLTRHWRAGWQDDAIVWVMLNPSTADETLDDPTIRRCIGFSKAWGAGGMHIVNLFAFRSTDPAALARADDPVGPDNDEWMHETVTGWLPPEYASGQRTVVAAWGAHPFAVERAAHCFRTLATDWLCLGTTKDGHPRHPLYVPKNVEPQAYEFPFAREAA